MNQQPISKDLLAFKHAFENCSMSSAARLLGVTQPAISHSIGRLEGNLRVMLFARNPKANTIQPTVEATRLHATVCDMLDSWSEFRQSV